MVMRKQSVNPVKLCFEIGTEKAGQLISSRSAIPPVRLMKMSLTERGKIY